MVVRAQEAQLPDSANLRVLAALRAVLAALTHSAPPPEPRPPSRAASPFAASMGGGLHSAHHSSWASDSLDSLATAGSGVRTSLHPLLSVSTQRSTCALQCRRVGAHRVTL